MLLEVSDRMKNKYCFWFVLSFILNNYSSGIQGVSIGSVVFIMYTIHALVLIPKDIYLINIENSPLLMVYSFCILTILAIFFLNTDQYKVSNIIFGVLKLLLWSLMIIYVTYIFVDYDVLLKWLTRLSILLTIYIIIQSIIFYIFSIRLPNVYLFGILKPYSENFVYYVSYASSGAMRPGSLLSEPAFYGYIVICTLVMYIDKYKCEPKLKNKMIIVLFCVGIIVSTSTSAIIFLLLIFLFYSFKTQQKFKYIVLLTITIYITFNLINIYYDSQNYFIKSLYNSIYKFQYYETLGRLGGSYSYIELIDNIHKFIGVGVGNQVKYFANYIDNDKIYLNSITAIFVQVGIIGLIIFILFIIKLFIKIFYLKDSVAFLLLVIYIILGFASAIYFSNYGILFLTSIFSRFKYFKNVSK